MKVMFVGRNSVENCGPWPTFAVVSMGEPDAVEGLPKIQPGWHSVLQLSFHDITENTQDVEGKFTLMADADAKAIVNFVREVALAPNVEGIIVHCRAGISRSAAVAKWICEQYSVPFNTDYDQFNPYVYRLMKLSGEGSSDDEALEAHLVKLRAEVNSRE